MLNNIASNKGILAKSVKSILTKKKLYHFNPWNVKNPLVYLLNLSDERKLVKNNSKCSYFACLITEYNFFIYQPIALKFAQHM